MRDLILYPFNDLHDLIVIVHPTFYIYIKPLKTLRSRLYLHSFSFFFIPSFLSTTFTSLFSSKSYILSNAFTNIVVPMFYKIVSTAFLLLSSLLRKSFLVTILLTKKCFHAAILHISTFKFLG